MKSWAAFIGLVSNQKVQDAPCAPDDLLPGQCLNVGLRVAELGEDVISVLAEPAIARRRDAAIIRRRSSLLTLSSSGEWTKFKPRSHPSRYTRRAVPWNSCCRSFGLLPAV